jgi:hypothetical protein
MKKVYMVIFVSLIFTLAVIAADSALPEDIPIPANNEPSSPVIESSPSEQGAVASPEDKPVEQTVPPPAESQPSPNKQATQPSKSADESGSKSSQVNQEIKVNTPVKQMPPARNVQTEPEEIESAAAPVQTNQEMIQDAELEGIQFSSENGKVAGEKVVTCYFIFRDKPSSYFYEVRKKSRKIIFEFNDTKKGTSPIPSLKESPIEGFTIEEKKVDVNKEVKGLTAEFHDLIVISFDMRKIPPIEVKDEYNIISFTYKWTTDQLQENKYAVKDDSKRNLVVWGSVGGVALIGGGLLIYNAASGGKTSNQDGPLTISDLPYGQQQ